MKYFIAMYDDEDYPYMIFENYGEVARYFNTTTKVIACNICRHQKKKHKGKYYTLHKIYIKPDEEVEIGKKNLHIGKIFEFLKALREIEKSILN